MDAAVREGATARQQHHVTLAPLDLVEQQLAEHGKQPKRKGDTLTACCPAHDDSTPSLSVTVGTKGRDIILHCHAGCQPDKIMAELGITWTDFGPAEPAEPTQYIYTDEYCKPVYRVMRGPNKRFWQEHLTQHGEWVPGMHGVQRVLYRLPDVVVGVKAGRTIYVVEGEKDADRMCAAGHIATCNSGGAGKFLAEHAQMLAGATVIVVADRDKVGYQHAGMVFDELDRVRAHVTVVAATTGKDASDHLNAGLGADKFVNVSAADVPNILNGKHNLPPLHDRPADTYPDIDDDEWTPIDLCEIARRMRDGNHQPTSPTVLAVDGALPLFYAERVNSLFGESGGGKTWVALAALCETVRNGERGLFVDYEDNANGITERLVLLGLDDEQIGRVDYVNPTSGIGPGVDAIENRGNSYRLIVVDSTGEAMAAGGVDSNADREVAQWFTLIKRLCRTPGGPAVVVLDHIPKAADSPSAFAIGSQRKRAAVTGAAYRVDTLKEPAKGRDGKLKLTVAKDRLGNRPKGSTAAVVDVSSADTVTLAFHVSEGTTAAAEGGRFRPTVYMERVSRWLESNPGASRRETKVGVVGKSEHVATATDVLIDEGWIIAIPGLRGASNLSVVRPFRDGMAAPTPDLSTYSPPIPRPVPGNRSDDLSTYSPDIHSQGNRGIGQRSQETVDLFPPANDNDDYF